MAPEPGPGGGRAGGPVRPGHHVGRVDPSYEELGWFEEMAARRGLASTPRTLVLAERDQLADPSRSSRLRSQYKKFCLR